ncbi:MAG TPA: hypothetical protein VFQ38_14790 [Longimicrobiales bacterium]|nr:hypothetical protein [Longimicrobiales bacterium]
MKSLFARRGGALPLLALCVPLWLGCAPEVKTETTPPAPAPAAASAAEASTDTQPAPPVKADSPAAARSAPPAAVADTPRSDVADATADRAAPTTAAAPKRKYDTGEDPEFAARMGWPVKGPEPLPGAILPAKRIVAYYGNPLSKRMGVLGEYPLEEMLRRFDSEIAAWSRADPAHPVQPALHLIAVVAQGEPGAAGKYRLIMRDTLVEQVYSWAKRKNAILFIDIQVGQSDIRELLPKFDHFLSRPDIHLAVDPEFMMKTGAKPGTKIGTMSASDINYVTAHVAELVRKNNLPPKVVIIHRFTRNMVTGSKQIQLRPEVQLVINMDGWGAPWLKRDSYRDYIIREPVQYTGFKLFYHNDQKKKGSRLMTIDEVLRLRPAPLYIQYQ